MIETIKCPVCSCKILEVGLHNHLIGKAKSELWDNFIGIKVKPSHLMYVKKNTKLEDIRVLKLKFK